MNQSTLFYCPKASSGGNSFPVGQIDPSRSLIADPAKTRDSQDLRAAEDSFIKSLGVTDAILYVVDDDAQVRTSLRQLAHSVCLNAQVFATAQEFLDGYRPDQPACLVLDVCLPGMNGVEFLERLRKMGCQIPTIVITAYGEVPLAVRAMKAGAASFIEKPYSRREILDQIHHAIANVVADQEEAARREQAIAQLAELSQREREVMQMFLLGENTKRIASRLDISPKTVDYHRWNLLKKMGVKSMVELAYYVTKYCD
ncbi:response regulator transcription factor [Planctomycetota bacterium]